ncbi:protein kinase [Streptomyces sp. A3M-1-3]|uniref:protein kinase n=1 Tax=Streptomyces sp. A3M-1-3 TaxID=2962044 RepID=UPI0020B7ED67|nr:protein kinase [Streptomyces sp. A3M-1-3]MCP3819952.1 protein kinase [Streptomyces sp. A3M-1-3]
MDDYAGRVLADRYRLPLPPSDEYELVETRAFDTYSGQEVLVRQVMLPEVVDAEMLDGDGLPAPRRASGRTTRRPTDPAVRRAIEAAQAAAQIPDHPRLDQVFDVFAEGGSLWIVSELVAARPLAALLAEKPLSPYRAAEVASDVLTALRVLHAHGWTHRNITVRTVLVCDDGRVVLTGLASGAAEEALCGYDPVPAAEPVVEATPVPSAEAAAAPDSAVSYGGQYRTGGDLGTAEPAELPGARTALPPGAGAAADVRAARAGAIAAYRAGARAAARVGEEQPGGTGSLPVQRPAPPESEGRAPGSAAPEGYAYPYGGARPGDSLPRSTDRRRTGEHEVPELRRAELAGTWSDEARHGGSGSAPGRSGSAAGSGRSGSGSWHGAAPRGGSAGEGLRADQRRQAHAALEAPAPPERTSGTDAAAPPQRAAGTGAAPPARTGGAWAATPPAGAGSTGAAAPSGRTGGTSAPAGGWDEVVAGARSPGYRGPATPLAAERARQTRIAVVGAVTERWAPEQAGPVHENWQLAAPVGPSTDLWALGALLFRAVQGHAPYPEENAAELVQMVCAEPPAFAEECGPLRPVVESLLRQDPTERPDFEELRGWLRSLVRSAPEPEAGAQVVPVPSLDGTRLPVVRRRGELVRRRRAASPAVLHGRHRQRKTRARPERARRQRGPRSLGRILLLLVLLALAAVVAYAVMFMPKAESDGAGGEGAQQRPGAVGPSRSAPADSQPEQQPGTSGPSKKPSSQQPQTTVPAGGLAEGYVLRKDQEGFQVAVDRDWRRRPLNDSGQVRYTGGEYELIIVPGRDTVRDNGTDPMAYQREKERELQPFRDSSWATSTGVRQVVVGQRVMAEGQYTWADSSGREVYVRNLATVVDGRYHVVMVIGPESGRDEVSEIFEQATATYRATS